MAGKNAQREQAEQPIQGGDAQIEVLYQISRGLNAARNERELLQVLAQPAIEAGALSAGLVYIDLDDSGEPEWVELVATWRQPEVGSPAPTGARFRLTEFPFSRLWLDNPDEAQLITDVDRDTRIDEGTRQTFAGIGARATVVVPLTYNRRWVGVLSFTWAEPHAYSSQEAAVYHALTGLAAPAVANRRLLMEKEAENRRLVENLEQLVEARTAKLSESRQVLESILDNIPLSVFWKDRDLRYLGCNRAYLDDAGLGSSDQLIGKNDYELPWTERAEQYRNADLEVLGSGKPKRHYAQPRTYPDGSAGWVETSKVPLRDETGAVWGVLGVYEDITERKRAEEALRESEEKFRNLAEHSPNMIFINKRGRVVYANQRCEEMTGYTRDHFYTADFDFMALIAPEHREAVKASFRKHMAGENVEPYEYTLVTKDGRRLEVILTSRLIDLEGERAILGTVTDITERKRAEEALRESERLLRTIAANYPAYLSIIERGEEGMTIGFTSGKEFARMNLDPDSFVGLTLEDVFGEQAPTVRQHYLEAFRGEEVSFELFASEQYQFYSVVPLYDGDEVTALLAVVENITERVQAEEALRELNITLEARVTERTAELRAQYARLNAILSSTADGIAVIDGMGSIVQTNRVAQEWLTQTLSPEDVERLRQAIQDLAQQADVAPDLALELGTLDLELSAAQVVENGADGTTAVVVSIHNVSHLKALDRMRTTFITNISHELRTPVTTIQAYAYLMEQTSPEDEKWGQYMRAMLEEVDRQVQLVEDILRISRIYAGRLSVVAQPTFLNELAEATSVAHQPLAQRQGLLLTYQPVDPSPEVMADPRHMTQVLNDLVGDAIRYTQAEGQVKVATGRMEAEGRVWATVSVSDTGERIPVEDLMHIFERFSREKEPRSARAFDTGLRLMIIREIVELHDGRVMVKSGEVEGVTFTIWLPLAD